MGPRSFAARRLADFLVDHGGLDERVQNIVERECPRPTSMPLRSYLADDARDHVRELPLVPHHAAILLVASLVVARRLKEERERRKKRRLLVSSDDSARLADRVEAIPAAMASAAACLGSLLVLSSLADDEALAWTTLRRELSEKYLFASSLWLAVISVVLAMASVGWGVLDPRSSTDSGSSNDIRFNTMTQKQNQNNGIRSNTVTQKQNIAKACATAETAVSVPSVVAVLGLAHFHLPLFRHALRGEVDLGLPPRLSQALNQALSSFLVFCAFSKFLIKPAESAAPQGTRKAKRYVADPALVKRMSLLAQEARERVQARKSGRRQLRRTYSEGNFGNFKTLSSSSPVEPLARRGSEVSGRPSPRRHGALSPLPEHDHEEGKEGRDEADRSPRDVRWPNFSPECPLRDIQLAGPTLSSSDLLAKLKGSRSIKRSASVGCIMHLGVPRLADEEIAY